MDNLFTPSMSRLLQIIDDWSFFLQNITLWTSFTFKKFEIKSVFWKFWDLKYDPKLHVQTPTNMHVVMDCQVCYIWKIWLSLWQAIDRLPTLTEEIWKIGCERISPKCDTSSGDVTESISVDESQKSDFSNWFSAKDQKVKELEEYPRPLAVVGVSVL